MSDLHLPSGSLRTRRQRSSHFFRNIYSARQLLSSSYTEDEDDAITPCPVEPSPPAAHDDEHHHPRSPLSRSSSSSSLRSTQSSLRSSIEDLDTMRDYNAIDTQLLWRRMLAIQRTFGCYNSTRMQLAIEMGEQNASVRMYNHPVHTDLCVCVCNEWFN